MPMWTMYNIFKYLCKINKYLHKDNVSLKRKRNKRFRPIFVYSMSYFQTNLAPLLVIIPRKYSKTVYC